MVGSKRCYLCGEPIVRGEAVVVCEECGVSYHAACDADRDADHCPRCVGEGWISVVEF